MTHSRYTRKNGQPGPPVIPEWVALLLLAIAAIVLIYLLSVWVA